MTSTRPEKTIASCYLPCILLSFSNLSQLQSHSFESNPNPSALCAQCSTLADWAINSLPSIPTVYFQPSSTVSRNGNPAGDHVATFGRWSAAGRRYGYGYRHRYGRRCRIYPGTRTGGICSVDSLTKTGTRFLHVIDRKVRSTRRHHSIHPSRIL